MVKKELKSLMLIALTYLGLFCNIGFAQEEEDESKIYDKLMALYISEQYDKLANQAVKFSEKDKYKKSPIPFLFASMAYFEMSNSEKWRDEEPKAFKLAMKYAKKYNRKDKENELYKEFEDSYFTRLREATIGEGMMLIEQKDYRKSMGFFKALTDIDENDYSAWIMLGYIEFKANMAYNAAQSIKEAQNLLSKNPNHSNLYPEQKSLLKSGLMFYSEYLNNEGMSDSAKAVIKIGEPLFKEDKEYQMMLKENGL